MTLPVRFASGMTIGPRTPDNVESQNSDTPESTPQLPDRKKDRHGAGGVGVAP